MTTARSEKGRTVMLHKFRIALAAIIMAVAATAAVDSASALGFGDRKPNISFDWGLLP
jgi:hypothetical protein